MTDTLFQTKQSEPRSRARGARDLTGAWSLFFTQDDARPASWESEIICQVPGGIHAALEQAGLLPSLTEELGLIEAIAYEQKHKWLVKSFSWEKTASPVPMWLVFDGVDPGCEVFFNGTNMGSFRGMFGGPNVEITHLLRDGVNEIVVHLSPELLNSAAAREGLLAGIPNQSDETNGDPYLKPSQLMGGNGFPRVITAGIWQPVRIEPRSPGAVRDLWMETISLDHEGARVLIQGSLYGDVADERVEFTLTDPKGRVSWQGSLVSDQSGRFKVEVLLSSPELWWPNGSGSQPLYTVSAVASIGGVIECRAGVRTLRWQRNTGTDSDLTLTVNGQPIFARGANWPTFDKQLDFSDCAERYAWLLGLAVRANVNVMRYWGGYAREQSEFYQLCDQLGILLLHDFPVANNAKAHCVDRATYETQVRTLIRGLRGHPCIAGWLGGNELRQCEIKGTAMESLTALGAKIAAEEDPRRRHFHSSYLLQAGLTDEYEHYGRKRDALLSLADILPSEPKFSVEFNSGSHCSFMASEGLNTRLFPISGSAWPPTSAVHLRKINTAPWTQGFFAGNLPARGSGENATPYTSWEELSYYSELFNGFSLRAQIGNWRSRLFRCSGSLVWSWHDQQAMFGLGAIDYFGAPKAVYYFLKRAFVPFAVSFRYLTPELDLRDRLRSGVSVVNESGESLEGYSVRITIYDERLQTIIKIGPKGEDTQLCNGSDVHFHTSDRSIENGSSLEVIDLNGIGYLFPLFEQCGIPSCESDPTQSEDRRFFSMIVVLSDHGGKVLSREFYPFNFAWYDRADVRDLPSAALVISEADLPHGQIGYEVSNTSDVPSVWTRFTIMDWPREDYCFDDNWITIPSGESVLIRVTPRRENLAQPKIISWRAVNGRGEGRL